MQDRPTLSAAASVAYEIDENRRNIEESRRREERLASDQLEVFGFSPDQVKEKISAALLARLEARAGAELPRAGIRLRHAEKAHRLSGTMMQSGRMISPDATQEYRWFLHKAPSGFLMTVYEVTYVDVVERTVNVDGKDVDASERTTYLSPEVVVLKHDRDEAEAIWFSDLQIWRRSSSNMPRARSKASLKAAGWEKPEAA